jgi:hypothetical protein
MQLPGYTARKAIQHDARTALRLVELVELEYWVVEFVLSDRE